jgi:hypothetical protein
MKFSLNEREVFSAKKALRQMGIKYNCSNEITHESEVFHNNEVFSENEGLDFLNIMQKEQGHFSACVLLGPVFHGYFEALTFLSLLCYQSGLSIIKSFIQDCHKNVYSQIGAFFCFLSSFIL